MADFEGPERYEPTEDSIVKFTASNPTGSFTIYLEPGESVYLADDSPNGVEVEALSESASESERGSQ